MPRMSLLTQRRRLRAAALLLTMAGLILVLAACSPKRVIPVQGPTIIPSRVGPDSILIVRVGMAENEPELVLSARGAWRLSTGYDRESTLIEVPAGGTLRLAAANDMVMVADSTGLGASYLVAEPVDPEAALIWDGRQWRGRMGIFQSLDGAGLTLVNRVELESYLAGVVPREIGNGRERKDLAAVAAQAVAARTYTISKLGGQEARGFDLFSDVRDQAYGGVDWEDPLCNEALELTRGLVMRRGGMLSPAYYHSTCGGHTAAIHEVWPYDAHAVLTGRDDQRPDGEPWCVASKYADWETTWTWPELESVLQTSLPRYVEYARTVAGEKWARGVFSPSSAGETGADPGPLVKIEVRRRTSSGRVAALAITTGAGTYVVRGDRTRWVLRPPSGGPTLLRSSWFDLDVDSGRSVTARGRGWGHGLGLCQMGALGRARAGQSFADILASYYRGITLEDWRGGVLP